MNLPRLVVAAPRGRSGKTLLSMGLCAALRGRGLRVLAFKRGPDFIDPSWLTAAAGRACRNLDIHLMGEAGTQTAFRHALTRAKPDFALIEGAMGLFDGLGPEGEGSTAHLARLLHAPVLLMVDASRMTRSAAALVRGFQHFEPELSFAGVVFNHVNHPRHLTKLRAALERDCQLPVLGALPDEPRIQIPQRHLGLIPHEERIEMDAVTGRAGQLIREHTDLEAILHLAGEASPLEITSSSSEASPLLRQPTHCRIGVARDAAFHFYYPENLEALENAGAELVPFSPLDTPELPPVDGLYLGGGFPEVFMDELADNASLRQDMQAAVESGMPVYAECGGLMYLARSLTWKGVTRPMAGALPCEIEMTPRPQGHGYVHLQATARHPYLPEGSQVRGHEFHHSRVRNLDCSRFAYRVQRGNGLDGAVDGLVYRNVLAGYTHLHALGTPAWAEGFVRAVAGVASLEKVP